MPHLMHAIHCVFETLETNGRAVNARSNATLVWGAHCHLLLVTQRVELVSLGSRLTTWDKGREERFG